MLSKATKLVKECIEKGKTHSMNMSDELEWDTKTLASAVKMYLNKQLGEPLFTFVMHHQFIDAASELISKYCVCSYGKSCDDYIVAYTLHDLLRMYKIVSMMLHLGVDQVSITITYFVASVFNS